MNNEIVIFHVEDPNPALNFGPTPNRVLFDLCIKSIKINSKNSFITVLTDEKTDIFENNTDINIVRHKHINTDILIYERSRLYTNYLKLKTNDSSSLPIIFMDLDILVTRDLGDIFYSDFDVGLTYRIDAGVKIDNRGIPINTQVSPINGGVIFVKPNKSSLNFFNAHMQIYDHLYKHEFFDNAMSKDIRKWGGDQFALMNMAGHILFSGNLEDKVISSAKVKFFPCDIYNYTPDPSTHINRALINSKYIIHLKGPRKSIMPDLANWLGIR